MLDDWSTPRWFADDVYDRAGLGGGVTGLERHGRHAMLWADALLLRQPTLKVVAEARRHAAPEEDNVGVWRRDGENSVGREEV